MNSIQLNSFSIKTTNTFKHTQGEEMQLKAKSLKNVAPLYNYKQQQTSKHNTQASKESNKHDLSLTTKLHLMICFDRMKSQKAIFHSKSTTGISIN